MIQLSIRLRQRLLAGIFLSGMLAASPLHAQLDQDDTSGEERLETGLAGQEAQAILAQPLPDAADARYALLQGQWRAALALEDRARQITLLRQLADMGRGRPGGEDWILRYLNAEFTWGSSGKALEACDPFLQDKQLSAITRATVAQREAYFRAQAYDHLKLENAWSRAESLTKEALAKNKDKAELLQVDRLQVRSEVERRRGHLNAAVATLREAITVARRIFNERQRRQGAQSVAASDAYGRVDGSNGMLLFALLRIGRAPEAVEIARSHIAQWRSGQLGESYGARWNYRLAAALVANKQYPEALEAARRSEAMLEKMGASPSSHTRWLARMALIRALIGTQQWQEADQMYGQFLRELGEDGLARERARDSRLIILLAAKSGRLGEALELAERFYRFRYRLYGADHPLTREAAGVRGVVLLLRREPRRALEDYEQLFAATVDNPGGWLDLESSGFRNFVFDVAFGEFMNYVAEQSLLGTPPNERLSERARQVADRLSQGVTQRALADSTARVLAATPALRQLLEAEQQLRRKASLAFEDLSALLAEEDRMRKEMSTEAYKAKPREERKPVEDQLRSLREQIKTQQAASQEIRKNLSDQRESIAASFPAYAELIMPATPKREQLQALLADDEALIQIFPLEKGSLIWLLGGQGRQAFHVSPLSKTEISEQVAQLRSQIDLGNIPAGKTPMLPVDRLQALYQSLIAPFDNTLSGITSLIITADGPLASLPLAALVTGKAASGEPLWLIQRLAITQLPSTAALQALRRVQAAPANKALLGFGDPLFDLSSRKTGKPSAPNKASATPVTSSRAGEMQNGRPELSRSAGRYEAERGFRYGDIPPLPETRTELQAIARAVGANPKSDLVFGAAATRRAVLNTPLQDRRIVAFATHGLLPGELPGVSKPALAMAADKDEREPPLLELDDVLNLRLNAQWVLLSACNTAAGENGSGAMSGLVRGFFFAGARSVLATHWAVESESAAALSIATFEATHLKRAEALRQAQIALLEGRLGNGRWRHPFYWAPYALFGDPQR